MTTVDISTPLPAIQLEVPAMHREGTKPAGFIALLSREYPTIDGTNVLPFTLAHLVQVLAALTDEQLAAVVHAIADSRAQVICAELPWPDERAEPEPAEAPRPHPAAETILCQLFTYPLSLGLTEVETQAGLAELRELLRGRVRDECLNQEPQERGLGAEEVSGLSAWERNDFEALIRNEHALYRDAWERYEESQADCKAIRNENARLRAEVTRLNELAAKEKAERQEMAESYQATLRAEYGKREALDAELAKANERLNQRVADHEIAKLRLSEARRENARLAKELQAERGRHDVVLGQAVADSTRK